jgi:hypothetical protein
MERIEAQVGDQFRILNGRFGYTKQIFQVRRVDEKKRITAVDLAELQNNPKMRDWPTLYFFGDLNLYPEEYNIVYLPAERAARVDEAIRYFTHVLGEGKTQIGETKQ